MTIQQEDENAPPVYIEGYLHKKEERNKWVEFWVALEGRFLKFQRHKLENENIGSRLIGWIELTKESKCYMGRKKDYSFPFYIQKPGKRYLFKTSCTLSRHRWVKAIELSIQGKSPCSVPRGLGEVSRNCSLDTTSSDETSGIDAFYTKNCPSRFNGQRPRPLKRSNENFRARSRTKSLDTPTKICQLQKRSSSAENIIDLIDYPESYPNFKYQKPTVNSFKGHSAPKADVTVLTSKNDSSSTTYRNAFVFQKDDAYPEVINVELENDRHPQKTFKPSESSAFSRPKNATFTRPKKNTSNKDKNNQPIKSSEQNRSRKENNQSTESNCVVINSKHKEPVVVIDENIGCKKRLSKKEGEKMTNYFLQKRQKSASFSAVDKSPGKAIKNSPSKEERNGQKRSRSLTTTTRVERVAVSKDRVQSKIPSFKKQNSKETTLLKSQKGISKADEKSKPIVKKSTNDKTFRSNPMKNTANASNLKLTSANETKRRGSGTYQQSVNQSSIPILSSKTLKDAPKDVSKSQCSASTNINYLNKSQKNVTYVKHETQRTKALQIRRPQKYRTSTISTAVQIHKPKDPSLTSSTQSASGRAPSSQSHENHKSTEERNSFVSSCSSGIARRKSCPDTQTMVKSPQKKVKFPTSSAKVNEQGELVLEVNKENLESSVRKRSYSYTNGERKTQTDRKSKEVELLNDEPDNEFKKTEQNNVASNNNETTINEIKEMISYHTNEESLLRKSDKEEEEEELSFHLKSTNESQISHVKEKSDDDFLSNSALSKCIDLRRATSASSIDTTFATTSQAVNQCLQSMGVNSKSVVVSDSEVEPDRNSSFDMSQLTSHSSAQSKSIQTDEFNQSLNKSIESDTSMEPGEILMPGNTNNEVSDTNSTSFEYTYHQQNFTDQMKPIPMPILKSSKSVEFSEDTNDPDDMHPNPDYPDSVLNEIDRLYRSQSFSAADKKTMLNRILTNAQTSTRRIPPARLRTRSLTTGRALRPMSVHSEETSREDTYVRAFSQSLPQKHITISVPDINPTLQSSIQDSASHYEQLNAPFLQHREFVTQPQQFDRQTVQSFPVKNRGGYNMNGFHKRDNFVNPTQIRVQRQPLPNKMAWKEVQQNKSFNYDDTPLRFCSPAGEMNMSEIAVENTHCNNVPPPYQVNEEPKFNYAINHRSEIRSPRDTFIHTPSAINTAPPCQIPSFFNATPRQITVNTAPPRRQSIHPVPQNNHPAQITRSIPTYNRNSVMASSQRVSYRVPRPIEQQSTIPNTNTRRISNNRGSSIAGQEIIVNVPVEKINPNNLPSTNNRHSVSFSPREGGASMDVSTASSSDVIHRLTPSGDGSNASSVSGISGKQNGDPNADYALSDKLKEILIQGDKFGSMTYLNCDKSKKVIRVMSAKEKGGIFNKMFFKSKQNTKKENCL